MIYCVKYFNGSHWSINRLSDFVDAFLFATRNSEHFQIWYQNSKKLSERVLVAYQGELE